MAHRKPIVPRRCKFCGELFEPRKFRTKGPHQGNSSGLNKKQYCSKVCSNRARAQGWLDKNGYRMHGSGWRGGKATPEHHIVMEKKIGRPIRRGETVHHKNGIRSDNDPDNLELWTSRHGKGQRVSDRVENSLSFLREYGIVLVPPGANELVLGAMSVGG